MTIVSASIAGGATAPVGSGVTAPRIVVSDASSVEGSGKSSRLAFTIRVVGARSRPVSVAFATSDGSARSSADYRPRAGRITFGPGRVRTVAVAIVGDVLEEPDERLTLRLSRASGAVIADGVGIGTIIDDDSGDPRIAAAGDIACDPSSSSFAGGAGSELRCRQRATSDLLVGAGYAAVLALGDNQYESGTLSAYRSSYGPSWGRVRRTTRPVPGNHEYQTPGAEDYFRYFGASAGERGRGWYSYDVGSWHVVALNSNCGAVGGCGAGSAQERWLRDDLAAASASCTLAYWHHPRFSSGFHGDDSSTQSLWQALHEANAEIVLSGHDHDYERFAPLTATGVADPARGIRQFVVGTGGSGLRPFSTIRPGSEARDASSLGVLELTLRSGGYDWGYRAAIGSYSDSGSASCH